MPPIVLEFFGLPAEVAVPSPLAVFYVAAKRGVGGDVVAGGGHAQRPVTLTLAPADGSLFTFRARNATGYFGDDGKARLHFPLEPLTAPSVVVTVTAVCARCPGAMNLPVTRNVTLVHCTASRAVQSQAPHVVPAVPTTISQPSIVSTVPAALRSPHMQGGLVCVASDPQANASTATAVIPGSETAAAVVDVCRVQCPGWAGTYTTLSTLGVNAGSSGALRLPGIALRAPPGTISPNETVAHVAVLGARVLFWPLTIRLDTTTTTVATDRACPIPGTAISSQLSGAASHAADVSSLCARRNGSAPDSVGYGVVEVTRGVSVVDANGTLLLPTTTTGAAAVSFAAVISGVSRTLSAVHLPGTPVVSGPKANVSITATNTTRGTSFRVVAVYNSSSEAGAVLTLNLSLPIADLQTAGHLSMEAAIPPTALIAHDVGWSTANVTEQIGRCVLRPALAATVSQSGGNRVPCTTPSDQCSQLTVASARTVAASVVAADFAIPGGVSYRAVTVVSQLSSAIVVDATDTVTCSLQGAAAMTLGCQPHPRAIISDTTPLTVTSAFAPRHTGQLLRIGAGSVESVSATFTLPTVARRTLVRSVAGCTDAYPSTGDCPPGAQVTVAGVGLHRLAAALAPQPVAIFDATNGTLSESTSTAPALHFAPPSGSSWSLDTASRVTDTALFDSAALPATNTTAAERSVAVSWLAPIIASCGALTIAVNGTEIVCSGLHGATGHQAALAVRTTDAAQIAARAPPTQCALAPSEQSVSASTAAVTDPTTLLWQSPGAVQCAVPVVVPNAASAVATANSTVLLPSLNGTAKHVARVAEQSNRTITSRADSNATVQLNGTVLYPGVTLSMRARSNRPGDNAKTVNRCAWYASSTLRMNRTVGGAPMATDPATPTPADGLFGESERWAQCGGHGLCIDTDAGWQLHTARGAPAEAHGCVCFADLTRGFWVTPTDATATADADNVVSVATAVPCSVCGPWYEGSEYRNCTARCPASTQDPSLPCSGRGRCHDGRCYCDTPFGGVACGTQCPYDPLTGLLCAGHGACNTTNGTCDCAAGFDGPECAVCGPGLCGAACTTPIAMCSGCFNATNATAQCGANEICDPSSSQCRCRPGRFGPSCTDACPIVGTDTLPCSGHGVCGALSSMCDCTSGYVGSTCYIECPGHGTALGACSGHGTCVIAPLFDTATCACNVGYGGVNCSVCAAGYGGSACDTACPRSLGGDVCFGHGVCNTAGSCDCFSDSASGYWAGSSCDGCAVGAFGGQCAGQCLGNGCAACGGHGRCDDGVNGTGACICSRNDTAGGPGMWGGLDCLTCVTHWFGPQCNRRCPADQFRAVCGGHGSCTDGTTGTGHCVCAGTAFALANDAATGNMLCVECARGYAGPSCAPCGGVAALVGEPCSGHGACSQGRNGTGTCQCAHGYSGVNCDVPCLEGGLVCSGRGQCGASGCVCAGNYTAASRCAECADGFFGAACQPCPSCADGACDDGTAGSGQCVCNAGAGGALCDIPCPRSADGTVCSGHGSCDVATGTCACTTGGVSAWAGSACDRCAASHAGSEAVGCTIGCPSALGGLCADAGQCGNGTCSCDAGRCGEACEFSGAACDSNRTACPDRCNDRGFCAAATGTCHCDAGFAGARCEVTCAALNLCSGHGMCTATATVGSTVGRCICTFGYWGATCGNACPGGSAPCSGHGACSAMDGSCVCVAGYAGSECGRACPRWSNATSAVGAVCGGHGACDANTAECRCNAGFAGLSCEACAEGYFGALCGDLCDRTGGVTVGSDCVCRDGYGGIGCAVMCPLGSADPSAFVPTLCSGHGVCSAVNGTCVCSASYYTASCAVRCDVASCSTAPPGSDVGRWQCVPESGACACAGSPSEGFWGGLECLDCARGYWGPGCQARCACKHGTCGRYDGACNCDYDDVLGFWRGIVCDHCAEGYIGQWCRTRNAPVLDAAFGSMATSPDLDLSPSVVDLPTGGAGYRLRGSVTADDVARGVEVTLLDTTVILTAVVDTHGAASDCGGEGNNGGRQRTIRATKDLRPMAIAALPSHGGVAPPQVDPSATDDFRLTSVVRRSSHWFIVGALAVTEDTDSSSASSASATSSGVRKGVAVVLFSFPVSTAVDETEAETALSKTFASCVAVIPISYGSGDAYRAALLSTAATLALAHDGTAVVFFFDGDNVAGRRLDGSLIGVIRDVAASPGAVSLRTALGCPAGCGIIVASVTVSPFAAPTAASGDLALAIAGASGNGWFVLTAAVTAADMSIRAFASPPSVGGWATAPFAHTATMGAVLPMLREVEFNGDNCTEALTCSAGPLSSASAGQRVEFTCILLCADLAAQTTAAVAVTAPVFTAAPPTPVAAPKATVLRVSAAGADVAVTGFTLVAPTGGRSASATATRAFVVLTETESVGGRDVTVASSCIVTLDVDAAKVIGFVQRDQGGVALQLVLGLFAPSPAPAPATVPSCAASRRSFATAAAGDPTTTGELVLTAQLGSRLQIRPAASFAVTGLTPRVVDGSLLAAGRLSVAVVGVALDAAEVTATSGARRCFFRRLSTGRVVSTVAVVSPAATDDLPPATHRAVCVVPSLDAPSSCDTVEVSFGTSTVSVTGPAVTLNVAPEAVLLSAANEDRPSFGPMVVEATLSNVTVAGRGFVASGRARCGVFESAALNARLLIVADADVLGSADVRCRFDSSVRMITPGAVLRYSHDAAPTPSPSSSLAFGPSAVPFAIVSRPAGLHVSITAAGTGGEGAGPLGSAMRPTVRADASIVGAAATQDMRSNVLGPAALFPARTQAERSAAASSMGRCRCSVFRDGRQQRLQLLGSTTGGEDSSVNETSGDIDPATGAAFVTPFTIVDAVATEHLGYRHEMRCALKHWAGMLEFFVTPGAVVALRSLVPAGQMHASPDPSAVEPVDLRLVAVDASGNAVTDLSRIPAVVTAAWTSHVSNTMAPAALQDYDMVSLTSTGSPSEAGVYTFAPLVAVQGLHGWGYDLTVTTEAAMGPESAATARAFGGKAVNATQAGSVVTTLYMVTLYTAPCVAPSEYAVPLTQRCAPCPALAICDGTTRIAAKPGAWRSRDDSYAVYSCDAADGGSGACLGEAVCETGHSGPLCRVCEDDYGAAGSNKCGRCPSRYLSAGLVALIAVVLSAVVFFFAVRSVADGAAVVAQRKHQLQRIMGVLRKRLRSTESPNRHLRGRRGSRADRVQIQAVEAGPTSALGVTDRHFLENLSNSESEGDEALSPPGLREMFVEDDRADAQPATATNTRPSVVAQPPQRKSPLVLTLKLLVSHLQLVGAASILFLPYAPPFVATFFDVESSSGGGQVTFSFAFVSCLLAPTVQEKLVLVSAAAGVAAGGATVLMLVHRFIKAARSGTDQAEAEHHASKVPLAVGGDMSEGRQSSGLFSPTEASILGMSGIVKPPDFLRPGSGGPLARCQLAQAHHDLLAMSANRTGDAPEAVRDRMRRHRSFAALKSPGAAFDLTGIPESVRSPPMIVPFAPLELTASTRLGAPTCDAMVASLLSQRRHPMPAALRGGGRGRHPPMPRYAPGGRQRSSSGGASDLFERTVLSARTSVASDAHPRMTPRDSGVVPPRKGSFGSAPSTVAPAARAAVRAVLSVVVPGLQAFVVAAAVALFIVFPSAVNTAAGALRCSEYDYGQGRTVRVLAADHSVPCDDAGVKATAVLTLIGFALGLPAGLALLITGASRLVFAPHVGPWCCPGSQDPAAVSLHLAQRRCSRALGHTKALGLFYYFTGGYRPSRWWWECVLLLRKAAVFTVVAAVPNERQRVYAVMWALAVSMVVANAGRPFASPILSQLELVSMLSLVVTVNAAMVAPHAVSTNSDGTMDTGAPLALLLSVVVFVVNVAVLAVFAAAVGMFGIAYVPANIRHMVGLWVGRRKVEGLQEELAAVRQQLTTHRSAALETTAALHVNASGESLNDPGVSATSLDAARSSSGGAEWTLAKVARRITIAEAASAFRASATTQPRSVPCDLSDSESEVRSPLRNRSTTTTTMTTTTMTTTTAALHRLPRSRSGSDEMEGGALSDILASKGALQFSTTGDGSKHAMSDDSAGRSGGSQPPPMPEIMTLDHRGQFDLDGVSFCTSAEAPTHAAGGVAIPVPELADGATSDASGARRPAGARFDSLINSASGSQRRGGSPPLPGMSQGSPGGPSLHAGSSVTFSLARTSTASRPPLALRGPPTTQAFSDPMAQPRCRGVSPDSATAVAGQSHSSFARSASSSRFAPLVEQVGSQADSEGAVSRAAPRGQRSVTFQQRPSVVLSRSTVVTEADAEAVLPVVVLPDPELRAAAVQSVMAQGSMANADSIEAATQNLVVARATFTALATGVDAHADPNRVVDAFSGMLEAERSVAELTLRALETADAQASDTTSLE